MFSYLVYSVSFAFLLVLGGKAKIGLPPLTTVLYLSRGWWWPRLSTVQLPFSLPFISKLRIPFIYEPIPSTFEGDAAAGLHSSTFDLSANIEAGDSRQGLDAAGKREVQRVMKAQGVSFDEARRLVVQERFKRAGIGPDGRPRDPKFVSFS